MAKPQHKTLVQPDLFGGDAIVVGVVASPAPAGPAVRAPRRRKVHDTQLEGRRRSARNGPTLDQRCECDVKGNSTFGRTRQEVAARTGIELGSVCGAVDRLLKAGKLIEPVVGYDGAGRAIHYRREGRKVLVNALYATTFDWLAFGRRIGTTAA